MMGQSLFINAVEQTFTYGVNNYTAVERIAPQIILADATRGAVRAIPDTSPSDYCSCPAYRDGLFSSENDIDYDRLTQGDGTKNKPRN